MSSDLTTKKCTPCEGGTPPLNGEKVGEYLKQIPEWTLAEGKKKISRTFKFKNFKEAMAFLNKVALIAEEEGHHPDIHLSYNKLTLELWTHAIKGLSENDFIVAAKIDSLNEKRRDLL